MAIYGYLWRLVVFAMLLAGMISAADAGETRVAARMSEALAGSLDDGMIAATGAGYGRIDTSVTLRPGRNDAFRRRVLAANAAQSHFATSAHWMNAPSISLTRSE